MKTRSELIKAMQSSNVTGKSALNMRNEKAQFRNRTKRYNRLKKEEKKKCKLLIPFEYAVPFNPMTGEVDDQYNPDSKFRPTFSATSTAKILKGYANENQKSKETFMRAAGVTEWDTSDVDNINDVDKTVFSPYWVPRIFSLPTINVKIPAFTQSKSKYGASYEMHVEYDEMGNIVGELPAVLRAYNLLNDIFFERVRVIKEEDPDISEQAFDETKKSLRSQIPLSGLQASNWIVVYEIPLTAKFDISADVKLNSVADLENCICVTNLSKALREQLNLFMDGSYASRVDSIDFVELDMSCPAKGDNNAIVPTYSLGTIPLANKDYFGKVCENIQENLDSNENIEQIVKASSYVRQYDAAAECAFIETFHTVFDIESCDFLTNTIILKNAQILTEAFGQEGANLVAKASSEASDKDIEKAEEPINKETLSTSELFSDIEEVE